MGTLNPWSMSGDSEPAPFGHIMPTSKLHARGMSIAGVAELDASPYALRAGTEPIHASLQTHAPYMPPSRRASRTRAIVEQAKPCSLTHPLNHVEWNSSRSGWRFRLE